jgi:hypothetical protein
MARELLMDWVRMNWVEDHPEPRAAQGTAGNDM